MQIGPVGSVSQVGGEGPGAKFELGSEPTGPSALAEAAHVPQVPINVTSSNKTR
jgi:hypothetical protein